MRALLIAILCVSLAGCFGTRHVMPGAVPLYSTDADYNNITTGDLEGAVTVLVLHESVSEASQILRSAERIHQAYLEREDVRVLAVSVRWSSALPGRTYSPELGRYGFSMPMYVDRNGELASVFNVRRGRATSSTRGRLLGPFRPSPGHEMGTVTLNLPQTIVINRQGEVAYRRLGAGASALHDRRLIEAVSRSL
ncbi:hypothetical protein BH23BAC4_BH23BAC4_08420 [soil metagenome]